MLLNLKCKINFLLFMKQLSERVDNFQDNKILQPAFRDTSK